jgi:hypothetical protein
VISEKMNKNRKMRRDLKRSRITTEKEWKYEKRKSLQNVRREMNKRKNEKR